MAVLSLLLLALVAAVTASGSHAARVYVGGNLGWDDPTKRSAFGVLDGDVWQPVGNVTGVTYGIGGVHLLQAIQRPPVPYGKLHAALCQSCGLGRHRLV